MQKSKENSQQWGNKPKKELGKEEKLVNAEKREAKHSAVRHKRIGNEGKVSEYRKESEEEQSALGKKAQEIKGMGGS